MKDAGLRLRIEKELRDQFVTTCRRQGRPAAEVLRSFMRDYVVREGSGAQVSLFDDPGRAPPRAARRSKRR